MTIYSKINPGFMWTSMVGAAFFKIPQSLPNGILVLVAIFQA